MHKEPILTYLHTLREQIISAFQAFENTATFQRKSWQYQQGDGGGEIALLRGDVFEKAAVNFSQVSGPNYPLTDGGGPFFATGVSLVTHMTNPKAPTVHFNLRFIETREKFWLGGGYDLTPMGFPFEEDTLHFHTIAKEALTPFGENTYKTLSEAAKNYFYIPHWKKERGVGGIFFDHLNTGDSAKDFTLWKEVGNSFLKGIEPIYRRRVNEKYNLQDKELQLKMRGHYVEFNLIYDKGTKFGFSSQGNPEAILCSMPPLAAW